MPQKERLVLLNKERESRHSTDTAFQSPYQRSIVHKVHREIPWIVLSPMSEASLATSVPLRPMLRPTSAVFRAGASLVPSPVAPTTSPPSGRLATHWKADQERWTCGKQSRGGGMLSCLVRLGPAQVRSPFRPIVTPSRELVFLVSSPHINIVPYSRRVLRYIHGKRGIAYGSVIRSF